MLADEIKARMFRAMKAGEVVDKEILRVALGEITTEAARAGRTGSDDETRAVLKKLVKSNEESLAASTDDTQKATLRREIEVLGEFLPRSLGEDEVIEALAEVAQRVRDAKNDGQATGVAMQQLKAAGKAVDGKVVAAAVARMRAG